MKSIVTIIAYVIAAACIFVGIATFAGNRFFAEKLVEASGLRISPRFTGGEIVRVIGRNGCEVRIHRPVFDGLFSDRKDGFIQIDYIGKGALSPLADQVDYDNDGTADFDFSYDPVTKAKTFLSHKKEAVSLRTVAKVKDGYSVRVNLHRID
jgi:hypothetical protein